MKKNIKFLLLLIIFGMVAGFSGYLMKKNNLEGELVISDGSNISSATLFSSNIMNSSGEIVSFSKFEGQWLLINFWATWCAPCRKEMPMLSELQAEFGGDDFEVVTIATGRNTPAGISKFFADSNIENLPRYQDTKQSLASQMGVFGLPITVIMDPSGKEIARLRGDANWSSESAKAVIAELMKSE